MDSIWEKMVLEEKKSKAAALGVRVCDLEEHEELQKSMEENLNLNSDEVPLNKTGDAQSYENSQEYHSKAFEHPSDFDTTVEDDSEFHEISSAFIGTNQKLHSGSGMHSVLTSSYTPIQIPIDPNAGPWIRLMQEIVDKILIFVGDIDMCGYLKQTSKTVFQPSERVYHFIAVHIYLTQTTKKQLILTNWLTYENMLIHRPRLRVNGFYSLKTMYSHARSQDNFWEPKNFSSVETVFYRHFRFFGHGRVLYNMDTAALNDTQKLINLGQPIPKKLYEGTYTLTGRSVRIKVPLHYCIVYFELILLDGDGGFRGHHNMLQLVSHATRPLHYDPSQTEAQQQAMGTMKVQLHLPQRTDFRFHRFYNQLNLSSN